MSYFLSSVVIAIAIKRSVERFCTIDAGLANLVGQTRQRNIHAITDIERCLIDVRAQLKCSGDGQRAAGVGAGVEVEQSFDTAELFLDGGGDGFGQRLGAGAGKRRGNQHGRRRDLRILGDGQLQRGDQSGQYDDDGQHRCKDRARDEESGHELACLGLLSGAAAGQERLEVPRLARGAPRPCPDEA